MTTGTEVYSAALVLMDANNDADTSEYKSKALSIINILRGELYPYSDTFDTTQDGRPICQIMTDLDDSIGLDDYICQTVMPYGMAAHLLLDENPTSASFFNQRYMELLAALRNGIGRPVNGSQDIDDVYGGGHYYYNRFTTWGGD